ncbi:hypothetical protein BKA66DRAFT_446098 [Pyrenochaeta sp. MPI-SDFR-AT-0127]|nr:hypothetical protein BKA66DRAFT_446098 [Pyrenochaeta sp. MPI-SDFR-AT-0127]
MKLANIIHSLRSLIYQRRPRAPRRASPLVLDEFAVTGVNHFVEVAHTEFDEDSNDRVCNGFWMRVAAQVLVFKRSLLQERESRMVKGKLSMVQLEEVVCCIITTQPVTSVLLKRQAAQLTVASRVLQHRPPLSELSGIRYWPFGRAPLGQGIMLHD